MGIWAQLGRHEDGGSSACLQAGFVEATARAVRAAPAHPACVRLVESSCRAFATLAFGDNAGRAALRKGGVQTALLQAIERFPMEQKVQEMARALMADMQN